MTLGFLLSKMAFPLWGIFLATLFVIWYYKRNLKGKDVPKGLKEIPGPQGLPIIGNILQLGNDQNQQYCKWAEKYGSIFKVQLGKFTQIVVTDPKMTKEIFSDAGLTGRIHAPEFMMYEKNPNLGVFNSEGELWEVQRRFLLRQLRDFGFGKSSMEALIMEEVEEVISRYKQQAGKPVGEIRDTLKLAVVNSLWKIMSNQRFQHDDPQLLKLANNTSKAFNDITVASGVLIFMPWIKHIIPNKSGFTNLRKILEENQVFFEKAVNEHKSNFQAENLQDFIDVYLAEMKKAGTSSQFYGDVAEKHLVVTLFDMFFAGSDSTSMTLGWGVLYLCKFPIVQKKLQQEIDLITGNSRRVSLNDKPNMPYTLALIDEILRFSSIVPDGVPHRALTDIEFRGYHIPKNANVLPNLKFIHFDPKIWGDPEQFRPERFISADGKKYVKSENLQPFQIGRRQCVGESLARDSVFLYLTNLFQNFEMKFDPNSEEPSVFDSEPGFLRPSLPYSVIMTERL